MTHRQILLVIYGLMAGMFLSALDQTVVGTAIRTIGDDLHGLDEQAWVTTAYLIVSTIATPIYGKLSDIFGRRPLFIFAITVFVFGSLLASFSTSMMMLAGFRAVQGLGAGGLMSLPLAIMGDMLAPRERAKYQGYFLAVFGVSSVIGPLVGGLFAGAPQILFLTGWRWVFLINVPIGAGALLMVLAFLHLPRFGTRSVRIDWFGAAAVVATLVPLLLVAEQGRTWGWSSAGSIACYVIGAVGLIAFIVVETIMKDDAIIPLKLFRSRVFSMSTVLGVLVGFGMFGAMLTLPLYMQIVVGLSPTASGFATLPMILGLMIASIGSGQIISRTGRYRIFPTTGTAAMAIGFLWLTTMTIDKPLWYVMIGMFFVGLGLGQLMQTLTLASQNAVGTRDIGVATSASTFFRQIGGTLGTAILLSVLFSTMPANITAAMQNRATLTSALDAALTPSVAEAPKNRAIMDQLWTKITDPIRSKVQTNLDTATAKVKSAVKTAVGTQVDAQVKQAVTQKVTAAVQAEVKAGAIPATAAQSVIQQQVAAALPAAQQQGQAAAAKALPAATDKALATVAKKAHASVVNGRLVVDWSNASERSYYVGRIVPTIEKQIKKGTSKASSASTSTTSDTSFLNGADPRLSKPFLTGFNSSATGIYWVGLIVILIAFVLSLFFKVPPLRQRSALQEQADNAAAKDTIEVEAGSAAATAGAHVGPMAGSVESVDDHARV
ncbi:DHA2 family efflux MFS transporter permease subunit [Amnibacterium sp. CER49]|uniref:MDR family MFS transporter n=1 Tax=Amnibacterium sp. CER49 TaxID=3039161 RepID=UPI00244B649F|nr:DHA2 family efflux MFS transporter permease subunit [Amnibacterium sp. CER49]MDH2445192.1 DHA2 family efflux MFS transporter permease subunit [Amnibacterium sp. CER49]